jgi:hypothetical protein
MMGARRLAIQHTLRAAARVARPLLSTETDVTYSTNCCGSTDTRQIARRGIPSARRRAKLQLTSSSSRAAALLALDGRDIPGGGGGCGGGGGDTGDGDARGRPTARCGSPTLMNS